jgi:PKD repeat protein
MFSRGSGENKMKTLAKFILVLVLATSLPQVLAATTYYVDGTAGNDSNPGSESLPWKTISKVNGFAFAPGDTISFKRGCTWREQLTVGQSGTSGQPITYTDYGEGALPKIYGSDLLTGWNVYSGNVWQCPHSGTVFAVWFNASGTIKWGNPKTSLANCVNEYDWYYANNVVYVYAATDPDSRYTAVEGTSRNYSVFMQSKSYITVSHLDLEFSYLSGCKAQVCSHCNIEYNTVCYIGPKQNGDEGRAIWVNGTSYTTVAHNTVHDSSRSLIGIMAGGGSEDGGYNVVEYNTVYDGYHSCINIMRAGTSGNGVHHATVRYNLCYYTNAYNDVGNVGILIYTQGTDATHKVHDVDIYYNICLNTAGPALNVNDYSDSVNIYNNVVYGSKSGTSQWCAGIEIGGGTTSTNVTVKNNIAMNLANVCFYVADETNVIACDNNCWYQGAGAGTTYANINGTSYNSGGFAAYKSATGWDAHGKWEDPKFVNASGEDFHLQSSSPNIDAGQNLGLTRDFYGNSVPSGASADIGAHESASTGTALSASASASPTSGQVPLTVSFTGSASGGTSPYTYSWAFGDGASSTSQNPSHTYSSASNFTATLTVTDSKSATNSKSVTISVTSTVSPLTATASSSPTSGQAPLAVNFTGSATGGTSPYSYGWTFGDGGSSTSQNPSHTYSSAGSYTVTLTVTDSQSATNSKSLTINVTAAPTSLVASASASPTSGQAPISVNFTGTATGGTAPYSYSWTFGDGGSSTAQNPSHTYSSSGTFTATLTVTDSQSATNSKSITINVTAAPTSLVASASASPTSGQAPLTVSFTGSASGGTSPYSYSYTFGDGGFSTSQNPSHTYSSAGSYTATLTVTDLSFANASATVNITVEETSTTASLSLAAQTGAPAPGEGGTTDPPPGNYSYSIGSTVSVKSIAITDYRFSKWTGDIVESSLFTSTSALTMDNNKSLSATFCTKCADVNGDLKITPADAQLAFDIYLRKIASPTWCELENADVNCSGTRLSPKVTPADAQAIFHKYLRRGVASGDCSGDSRAAAVSTNTAGFINANLTIDNMAFTLDLDILIPIIIECPSEVTAFGFDLTFPSNLLTFIRLESTELTKGYDQLDANVVPYQPINQKPTNAEPAETLVLRVGGYKTNPDQSPSSGVLVTLIFRGTGELIDPNATSIIAAYDDLQNALVINRMVSRQDNSQIRENKRQSKNVKRVLPDKKSDF